MVIRDARHVDIEKIANLYISNWKNTYSGLLSQNFLDNMTIDYGIDKWSKYLSNKNNKLFVVIIYQYLWN